MAKTLLRGDVVVATRKQSMLQPTSDARGSWTMTVFYMFEISGLTKQLPLTWGHEVAITMRQAAIKNIRGGNLSKLRLEKCKLGEFCQFFFMMPSTRDPAPELEVEG